jgi:hypothetical protein
MKKLVFAMLAVVGMSLVSCTGGQPATEEGKQDQTVQVDPAPECEVQEAKATDANAEADKAAVTEEKANPDAAANGEAEKAPAEGAEKK